MAFLSLHDRIHDPPSFDELKARENLPAGCTWGFWDKGNVRDELGTLNFLTAEKVLEAKAEIQVGISVSLKRGYFTLKSLTRLT